MSDWLDVIHGSEVHKEPDISYRTARKEKLNRQDSGHYVVNGFVPGTLRCLWCGRDPYRLHHYEISAPCKYSEV